MRGLAFPLIHPKPAMNGTEAGEQTSYLPSPLVDQRGSQARYATLLHPTFRQEPRFRTEQATALAAKALPLPPLGLGGQMPGLPTFPPLSLSQG